MLAKIKSEKIIRAYYLIIAAILLSQVVLTVFRFSQTIVYQHRISTIQSQYQKLNKEYEELQLKVAAANSLQTTQAQLDDEFNPITAVHIISSEHPLALKF